MKTKTVINKFKKVGIEFKQDGNKFEAKSETQLITFHDQNGDAVCLGTSDIATNMQDRLDMIYQDIGYKTWHDSVKGAIEWVAMYDERASKKEA
jgi:hypothetical protein